MHEYSDQHTAWFYCNDNNQRFGPLSYDIMQGLVNVGTIKEDTLIWREGFTEWRKAGTTSLFKSSDTYNSYNGDNTNSNHHSSSIHVSSLKELVQHIARISDSYISEQEDTEKSEVTEKLNNLRESVENRSLDKDQKMKWSTLPRQQQMKIAILSLSVFAVVIGVLLGKHISYNRNSSEKNKIDNSDRNSSDNNIIDNSVGWDIDKKNIISSNSGDMEVHIGGISNPENNIESTSEKWYLKNDTDRHLIYYVDPDSGRAIWFAGSDSGTICVNFATPEELNNVSGIQNVGYEKTRNALYFNSDGVNENDEVEVYESFADGVSENVTISYYLNKDYLYLGGFQTEGLNVAYYRGVLGKDENNQFFSDVYLNEDGEYSPEKSFYYEQLYCDKTLYADNCDRFTKDGYILAESDSRLYNEIELMNLLTFKGLCYAKYEIYARHGLTFEAVELEELYNHFLVKPWYIENENIADISEISLSEIEKANLDTIARIENNNSEKKYVLEYRKG